MGDDGFRLIDGAGLVLRIPHVFHSTTALNQICVPRVDPRKCAPHCAEGKTTRKCRQNGTFRAQSANLSFFGPKSGNF